MTNALTINDFCEAYSISRSYFYKLKEQNRAPKTFTLGRKVLISRQAAEEWQRTVEISAQGGE